MLFDPENTVVRLCVQGMEQEMAGRPALAKQLFLEAWEKALSDKEKFTAAHYLARQQDTVAGKLRWDETALEFALKLNIEDIKSALPSLHLNIAKCHEDLKHTEEARKHYLLAQSFAHFLLEDEYGKMIRAGIDAGMDRIKEK